MFRMTSGSTASYPSEPIHSTTAKSCLFAQMRIRRSSKSVLDAKSPSNEVDYQTDTEFLLHLLETIGVATVYQENHTMAVSVILAP